MVHPLARNISWGLLTYRKWSLTSPAKNHAMKNHNEYHGNRVPAHTDSPREGEVIITLQLTEYILFHLKHDSDVAKESIFGPGSGYILRCPKNCAFNVESKTHSCDMKLCPRHGLYHAIECAHSTKCPFHHDANSATTRLGARKGPRFAVIMRYFKR